MLWKVLLKGAIRFEPEGVRKDGRSIRLFSAYNMENELALFAKKMGKKGGEKTLKTLGKKHYKKMAEKRWANEKKDK